MVRIETVRGDEESACAPPARIRSQTPRRDHDGPVIAALVLFVALAPLPASSADFLEENGFFGVTIARRS
jgi:hypothetical protein